MRFRRSGTWRCYINKDNYILGSFCLVNNEQKELSDQQIIVLDEATSALDDQTANKILNHILTLKDKTVFVVTHKYQNLKKCDKVFSIESGNIHQLDLTKLN